MSAVEAAPPFLDARGITKRFGANLALNDVTVDVRAGEVLCLLGDNGAGKSTLIAIMSGNQQPTRGELWIDGAPVRFAGPRDAREMGIATVQQYGGTVPLMSVTRNFFLGDEPTKGRGPLRRLDMHRANQIALESLRAFGLTGVRDPRQLVGTLSGGERQSLAIARAMHFGARALILDEPTSALGVKEAAKVLRLVAEARAKGLAVVFITHNAHHALSVGDRFAVLIQGEVAAYFSRGEKKREEVLGLMAGGEDSKARRSSKASMELELPIDSTGQGQSMKLGVVSSALVQLDFPDALDRVKQMGLDAIEIACAGWQTNLRHGDPAVLAHDADARERWLEELRVRELEISALGVHGRPLSPDPEVKQTYKRQFADACLLAEQIGVTRLTLLGGLPEAAEGDRSPAWVVNAFPLDQPSVLEWQWEQRVIPYWTEQGRLAEDHGCKLCFELHPMDVLYNPRTLLRLREAVGPVVGVNFDPSHLWFQGIDPLEAIRALGEAIYHVHAKDAQVNPHVARVNGVLDATPFSRLSERAWSFRTVGFGHDDLFWRQFVSTLREIGYDDVLSIEHEDEYLDLLEGLEKGAEFLKPLILTQPQGVPWYELAQS